jgi:hypothetical protein
VWQLQQLEAKELQLRMSEVQLPAAKDAHSPALQHGGGDHAMEDRRESAALVQENAEYAQQVQQLRLLVAELKQAAKQGTALTIHIFSCSTHRAGIPYDHLLVDLQCITRLCF